MYLPNENSHDLQALAALFFPDARDVGKGHNNPKWPSLLRRVTLERGGVGRQFRKEGGRGPADGRDDRMWEAVSVRGW